MTGFSVAPDNPFRPTPFRGAASFRRQAASITRVAFELDHIFVCAAPGAPEAEGLLAIGLAEGAPNTHPGQGTSNRRFFFHNAMLELLWVHDEAEACSPETSRTRLYERWSGRTAGSCPFGLCFRPINGSAGVPFAGWSYTPRYLPLPLSIHIGSNSDRLDEPMLFHIPFGDRPDKALPAKRQPLAHRLALRELTRVTWLRPAEGETSRELRDALETGQFSVAPGSMHTLQLGFDHERRGVRVSLMPTLPITLSW